ncbi:MAG TPA: SDR family NAD(P)-dependent oxidoreductase, partial [Polyangia bacterium]|nr:SDR family NAD(P)-dependent oxidoreductase [Polyangia bacterium]
MRRALVTGGTKGIGLAVARALVAAGHEVLALYAHDEAAAQAVARDNGSTIAVARCDVSSATAVQA